MLRTWNGDEIIVYTDYSGRSDQVAYLAVTVDPLGREHVYDYDTKIVSSKYSYDNRFTEGELKGVLWAMRNFPRARILTDCRYAVREADSDLVDYIPGHSGYPGNEHADHLAKYGYLNPDYGRSW